MAQSLSVNLGLPATPLAQTPEVYSELRIVYNAIKAVAAALDSYTGALPPTTQEEMEYLGVTTLLRANRTSKVYVRTFEDLVVGETVAFDANLARKAVVTTYPARGVCSQAALAGEFAEITLYGIVTVGGLTSGTVYYASATPGVITIVPTAQKVGYAINATTLVWNPDL